ncbi:MAG TPA: hypothetical protein VJ735_19375, partial [Actinomycetes bacterium]|nr:hypothetical protein [Actinomycetes bacterium]
MRREHQANHEHGEHGEREEHDGHEANHEHGEHGETQGHSADSGRRGIHWHPRHGGPGAGGAGEFEGVLGLLAGLVMSVGRGRRARLVAEL